MQPGFVWGLDPASGELLWQLDLPFENDGFVWPMSRMRFSLDGGTAYLGTTHNNYLPDPYSYLYAIDARGGIPAAQSADLTGDGTVGPADLAQLLGQWGPCAACDADLNDDGAVGPADLAALLANWG
jgi:hypothetical protein